MGKQGCKHANMSVAWNNVEVWNIAFFFYTSQLYVIRKCYLWMTKWLLFTNIHIQGEKREQRILKQSVKLLRQRTVLIPNCCVRVYVSKSIVSSIIKGACWWSLYMYANTVHLHKYPHGLQFYVLWLGAGRFYPYPSGHFTSPDATILLPRATEVTRNYMDKCVT